METAKEIAQLCMYFSMAVAFPVFVGWTIYFGRRESGTLRRMVEAKERENEIQSRELESDEDGEEWKTTNRNN